MRFNAIFYATLGASWSDATEECFDLELASESLRFFDSVNVPKLDGPILPTVTDIRFTSDISGASPLAPDALASAGALFADAVPVKMKC
jgi:hypothetical protein